MITILGALIGFITSAFPDFIKLFRESRDRQHELAILDRQMELQKLGASQRLEEIKINADAAEMTTLYKTFYSGVKWVDALNGTVRPVIAYAFFILYSTIKVMAYCALPEGADFPMVYNTLWTQDDAAIFAGIISFFYGSRALSQRQK